MIELKEIGKRICKLRGEISQRELAENLKISKSAMSMYERGERMPKDKTKERIAHYFGKSVQEIFFDDSVHI